MANGAAFDNAVLLAAEHPRLGVGVHLNIVEGQPISNPNDIRSLLDHDGRFLSVFALVRRHLTGTLKLSELQREVETQIGKVRQAGLDPTHVDAHKNIHAYPAFFSVIAETASKCGIRAVRLPLERPSISDLVSSASGTARMCLLNAAARRCRPTIRQVGLATADRFAGTLKTGAVTADWLLNWVGSLGPGSVELMVHPGFSDDELMNSGTRLTAERETELKALTDARVIAAVRDAKISVIHYGHLSQMSSNTLASVAVH